MTEHEARERWINELLRHEKVCRSAGMHFSSDDGTSWGDVHDSRSRVYDAEQRYRAICVYEWCLLHGDRATLRAKLSIDINEATAELTPKDGGS
jgi:hypothetical protein